MFIKKDETKISGSWIFNGITTIADDNCARIDWLCDNYLKEIAIDESGWFKLYQDPDSKRYWQRGFEQSEMNGGGPPYLVLLSEQEANAKYKI